MSASSSIDIPELDRCPFCDYLAGRRPYTIVARGEHSALFVTREQRGVSHLLALPVVHRATLLDLQWPETEAVMHAMREGARAIAAAERVAAISVWQNNGINANQTIGHVHFHIAGTREGEETERGEVQEVGLEVTERIAQKLRAAHNFGLK